MAYITRCKKCGGELVLSSAVVVNIRGVGIYTDGFDICQASGMDTESEQARCVDCGDISDLEYDELEDEAEFGFDEEEQDA